MQHIYMCCFPSGYSLATDFEGVRPWLASAGCKCTNSICGKGKEPNMNF